MTEDIAVFWNVKEQMTLIVSVRQKTTIVFESKGADYLDCLCKTKYYDSLWKVKVDDIDSLRHTKDYDSLWNDNCEDFESLER